MCRAIPNRQKFQYKWQGRVLRILYVALRAEKYLRLLLDLDSLHKPYWQKIKSIILRMQYPVHIKQCITFISFKQLLHLNEPLKFRLYRFSFLLNSIFQRLILPIRQFRLE